MEFMNIVLLREYMAEKERWLHQELETKHMLRAAYRSHHASGRWQPRIGRALYRLGGALMTWGQRIEGAAESPLGGEQWA